VAVGAEIEGTLEGVNAQSRVLLLQDGTPLAVQDDTQITIDGQRGRLENLKVGDTITVRYEEHGTQNPAITIAVRKRSF